MARNTRRAGGCSSTARVATSLFLSFFILSATVCGAKALSDVPQVPIIPPRIPTTGSETLSSEHIFSLRHIFHRGTRLYPNLHRRLDVSSEDTFGLADEDGRTLPPHFRARSRGVHIERLVDRDPSTIAGYLAVARDMGEAVTLSSSAWTLDEVSGPNVTDYETVLNFAIMTANAYNIKPGDGDWEDVSAPFDQSQNFGWEGDGLRGHIFADEGNKTIIISLKGTSFSVFGSAETETNDKENDNLFFGCCCGQGGNYLLRQVCDCYTQTYTCNKTCLVKALRQPNRYYSASLELYGNITALYPDSVVWLAGHSLGGSTSSLLAMTYGLPVVTFEAPGEALPALRLGLPIPPGHRTHQGRPNTGAYHFGHTADPIYMGTCNGASSLCTIGGYAMESVCHTGQRCVWDTVGDKGWRVGIANHKIRNVIKDVIRTYNSTPSCEPDTECQDCFLWKFETNGPTGSSSSTSTATSTSKTRTSTCKTRGWWGCLDETTTTTSTTASTLTTTSTTMTCETPGWFGCKGHTTTTLSSMPYPSSSTAVHTPAPTMTITRSPKSTRSDTQSSQTDTTCETPGFFWGCHDRSTNVPSQTSSSASSQPISLSNSHDKHHTCMSRALFGLICVTPSPTSDTTTIATAKPMPSNNPPREKPRRCVRRNWWFGRCTEWEWGPDPDNVGKSAVQEL